MMQVDDRPKMKNNLIGECLAFGLLGRVIYNLPERDWLEPLLAEDIFNEVPYGGYREETKRGQKALINWVRNQGDSIDENAVKELKADFTRLFVGGKNVKAPPWESVYFTEDRLIFQEQTLQVRSWFRRYGLEVEKLHQEPDDHIGLEMSFVAHLAELSLKALEDDQVEKALELIDAKRQFLSDHLLVWGPMWCELVSENATTAFYKGISDVTLGVLLEAAALYGIEADGG